MMDLVDIDYPHPDTIKVDGVSMMVAIIKKLLTNYYKVSRKVLEGSLNNSSEILKYLSGTIDRIDNITKDASIFGDKIKMGYLDLLKVRITRYIEAVTDHLKYGYNTISVVEQIEKYLDTKPPVFRDRLYDNLE